MAIISNTRASYNRPNQNILVGKPREKKHAAEPDEIKELKYILKMAQRAIDTENHTSFDYHTTEILRVIRSLIRARRGID